MAEPLKFLMSSTRSAAHLLLLAGGLFYLTGCNGQQMTNNDPLRGGPTIPASTVASATTNPTNRSRTSPLPDLPAPAHTTSQAALAAGVNQSLDTSPSLRIPAGLGTTVSNPNGAAGPGVSLSQPQPITTSNAATPIPVSVPGAPVTSHASPAGLATPAKPLRKEDYAMAQQTLASRGVLKQKLEDLGNDVWRFSCSLADRQAPNVIHRYQAEATGNHGLTAIWAVLDEIDRDQINQDVPR